MSSSTSKVDVCFFNVLPGAAGVRSTNTVLELTVDSGVPPSIEKSEAGLACGVDVSSRVNALRRSPIVG